MTDDKFSKEERSSIMSKIKKTNTKPEIITRKYLFSKGLRYRIHTKDLIGNPDIVLPKYKTIIFINGCFWHAHEGCRLNRMPKSNTEYWTPKILKNVERDVTNNIKLTELGWRVITVWECDLSKTRKEVTLTNLYNEIVNYKINEPIKIY